MVVEGKLLANLLSNMFPQDNGCIYWGGKCGVKVGPTITVKGHARSVRRLLWNHVNANTLREEQKLKQKVKYSGCFFRCVNLDHFDVVQRDTEYEKYW